MFSGKNISQRKTSLNEIIKHLLQADIVFFSLYIWNKNSQLKIAKELKKIKDFVLVRTAWETIIGHFTDCKFSLFYYHYPLIEKSINYKGVEITSLKDLAASKIGAIASRGTKRDFVDLYYILKSNKAGDLNLFLEFYDKRFGNLSIQKFHIIKSLNYFADADKEEDPKMIASDYSWENIKKYLQSEVKKLI